MEASGTSNTAIAGCGPTGCFIVGLLRQSAAKAKLITIDDSRDTCGMAEADQRVLVRPGEVRIEGTGPAEVVFIVLNPAEGRSLEYARALAKQASAAGAFAFGLAVLAPGDEIDELELKSTFDGTAVVDAGWVASKRSDGDQAKSLQVAFNFTAHALTFFTRALASGEMPVSTLKSMTSGGVAGFAASHISEPEAIYAMTMAKIDKDRVQSGIVFVDATTTDILSRRIFHGIAKELPPLVNVVMLRVNGLEPFKVVAMLAR